MGPIGCPKMSVRNHHHSLHNNPDKGSSRLLLGRSPKSHVVQLVCRQDLNRGLTSPLICCIVFVILAFLVSFKELCCIVFVILSFLVPFKELCPNLMCHSLHTYACFSILNGKYALIDHISSLITSANILTAA